MEPTHREPAVVLCLALLAAFAIANAACSGGTPSASYEGDQPGECSDGADNDRDGLFDCDDPGCAGSPECAGADGDGDADRHDDADAEDGTEAPPGCGDGVPTPGEECDDGSLNSDTVPDACRTDCRRARCGDSVTDSGEQCDDGNSVADDGCERLCRFSCQTAGECDDGDQCTRDSCDIASSGRACSHVIDTGEPCDDGNGCTTGERCEASGACEGGTNTCECTTTADCAPHEDGDPCNGTLVCVEPGCVVDPATIVTCDPVSDTACRRNTCQPATGMCAPTNVASGTACDDGLFCTATDTCDGGGGCTGTDVPCATCQACLEDVDRCDPLPGFCFVDGACRPDGTDNPTNSCEECVSSTSRTAWSSKPAGTACDDGLFCTAADVCDGAGACTGPGNPCALACQVCNDPADRCDVAAGNCLIDGVCYAGGAGNPSNSCRECRPTGSRTTWTVRIGASCDNGLFCDGPDTCDSSGTCAGSGDPCSRWCEPCNEGTDRCEMLAGSCLIAGACYADGVANPVNLCQACDTARSTSGWSSRAAGTPCDDGLFCTLTDACNGAGTCAGGADSLCLSCQTCNEGADRCDLGPGSCLIGGVCYADGAENPTNPCQECYASRSQTSWTNKLAGTTCSDANPCTTGDACNASGTCVGAVPPPAPQAPNSGAHTGTYRAPISRNTLSPQFRWRWSLAGTCSGATFDVQVDDSCATPGFAACTFPSPEASATGLTSTIWRTPFRLTVDTAPPVGRRYYWRVRACAGALCSAWSGVRYLDVGRVPADRNGDGYSDVVIVAPDASPSTATAWLFLGGDPPSGSWTLGFGSSADACGPVAFAGDVNADGFADFIRGCPLADGPGTNSGRAAVEFGVTSGFGSTVDLRGTSDGDRLGLNVGGAGDVNGDGFADVLVAAWGGPRVDLFFGGRPMDTVADQTFWTEADGVFLGQAIGNNVEIGGDGLADLLVADYRWRSSGSERGKAYLFSGGTPPDSTADWSVAGPTGSGLGYSLDGVGDVNGDGDADIIVGSLSESTWVFLGGSGFDVVADLVLMGPGSEGFGMSVSPAGDFNGDGVADWAVGAPGSSRRCRECGVVRVFLGGAVLDGVSDVDFEGTVEVGRAGWDVSSAGDVNGDGWADLLIGAPSYGTLSSSPAAYLLYGGASPDGAADVTYSGTDNTDRFGAYVAGGWW